jgi:hypothetical protein
MTFTSSDQAALLALIAYERTMSAIEKGRERWCTIAIFIPLPEEEL